MFGPQELPGVLDSVAPLSPWIGGAYGDSAIRFQRGRVAPPLHLPSCRRRAREARGQATGKNYDPVTGACAVASTSYPAPTTTGSCLLTSAAYDLSKGWAGT